MKKPRIGITIGDPSGVGPEISLKALRNEEVLSSCIPVLYGDASVLNRAASIVNLQPRDLHTGKIQRMPGKGISTSCHWGLWRNPEFARVQGKCGKAAFAYIKRAIEDALEKKSMRWSPARSTRKPSMKGASTIRGIPKFSPISPERKITPCSLWEAGSGLFMYPPT